MTNRAVVVGSDGRAKAYRPLPESDRAAALAAGLAAYEQGDFFAAHEHLEPAWMGTNDPVERAWLQGLIKLAAAYVHAVRGNPAGIVRNLEGARIRLAEAAATAPDVAIPGGSRLDLQDLIAAVDLRLADLAAHPASATLGPPVLRRSVR
jgi:predicted metal-dependent hydrolase